jgi:hypothetical protein
MKLLPAARAARERAARVGGHVKGVTEMTRNLANNRRGIPRGGLKAPAGTSVSNSPTVSNQRPAVRRGRCDDSPSVS